MDPLEGRPVLIEGENLDNPACEALVDWVGHPQDDPCGNYAMYRIRLAGKDYLACPTHARMWSQQQKQKVRG